MFFIRIQDTDPLMAATFLFSNYINEVAVFDFTPEGFTIIASNPSLRFISTFYIDKNSCVDFNIPQSHIASLSLPLFRGAIMAATPARFDTMAISFQAPNQMILTFENSSEYQFIS